jgi:hypothetical protein
MVAKKRRTKGTGTVFQRSQDKLWVGGVELPPNKDGTRNQRRVYGKTRSAAIAKLSTARRRRK